MKDITRLPLWAQDYIARLEGQVAHWKALAEDVAVKESETNVRLHLVTDYRGLPTNSTIRFGGRDDWFDVRLVRGELDVCTGGDILAVSPAAANHIRVFLRKG